MQIASPQGLLALRQLHTMTPYGTRAAYRARLHAKADLAACKALASKQLELQSAPVDTTGRAAVLS